MPPLRSRKICRPRSSERQTVDHSFSPVARVDASPMRGDSVAKPLGFDETERSLRSIDPSAEVGPGTGRLTFAGDVHGRRETARPRADLPKRAHADLRRGAAWLRPLAPRDCVARFCAKLF